jgi:carboxypeptidase family protein
MTGEMTAVVLALALSLSGTARAQQAAVVSGTVVDPIGAAVTDARVALAAADGTPAQIATTGAKGEFAFPDVPAGSYVVRVDVTGFTPFSTGAFTVGDGGRLLTVPPIVLAVEGFSTSVVVRATEAIAEEQIKAQEQQRWLGVFPSFYVSYLPNAAPMTSRQKLTLAAHETFDWTAFVGASVAAAIDQSTAAHPGFGEGASGYAKRWAASFADDRTGDLLSHYVFASVFRQEPRYFYQGTGTTKSRLIHALGSAFVARSDRGTTMPNYACVFGSIGAAALSNMYYQHSERGASLMVSNLAISLRAERRKLSPRNSSANDSQRTCRLKTDTMNRATAGVTFVLTAATVGDTSRNVATCPPSGSWVSE